MPEIESSSESAIMEEDTHTDSHAHTLLSLHSSFAICIVIGTGERFVTKRRHGMNTGLCVTTTIWHAPFLSVNRTLLTHAVCLPVYGGLVSILRCVHANGVR